MSTSRLGWGYRPALDGVRAVAIYLVVVFHAGVSVFPGGFVGVDLFFVLSGFLVTRVLTEALTQRNTSAIVRFYARRIRRLLPAATLAIIGTCALFVAVAPAAERLDAIGDARSAALYFSNWHFLTQTQDYFAAEQAASPFLQFWSLSIEEQFYFVFPVLLLGFTAVARRIDRRLFVVSGLATLAAGLAVYQIMVAGNNRIEAYYATPARLYQLLAGAVLALTFEAFGTPRRLHRWGAVSAPLALVALIVVASSWVTFDPSSRGLAATACAVLLIGGLELAPTSRFAVAVGTPGLNYLGRISYGTYLWHWPVIIVLDRAVDMGSVSTALTAIVVGSALGSISHQLLELPIRRSPRLDRHPVAVIAFGLGVSAITGLLIAPAILRSQRPMVIPRHTEIAAVTPGAASQRVNATMDWAGARTDTPREPVCLGRSVDHCVIVQGSGLHLHLVGDSHAKTLLPLFEEMARQRNYTFSATITRACPWQRGLQYVDTEDRTRRCLEMQPDWYDRVIPALAPDVVLMFNGGLDDPHFPRSVWTADDPGRSESKTQAIRRTTDLTVEALVNDGRRVVILEPIPKSKTLDPTACLSSARLTDECNFGAFRGTTPTESISRLLALSSPSVFSINLDHVACPQFPTCVPVIDGFVARRDRHHLTGSFAKSRWDEVAALLDAAGALNPR